MARRNNASFTGTPLSGDGYGPLNLVEAFYDRINRDIPGDEPVPIPPPESVNPKHNKDSQLFIFVDYAVHAFAPIALDAAGLHSLAAQLRTLTKIVDLKSQRAAARTSREVYDAARHESYTDTFGSDEVFFASEAVNAAAICAEGGGDFAASARGAASAAYLAAKLNPEATWEAVNEMLAAL